MKHTHLLAMFVPLVGANVSCATKKEEPKKPMNILYIMTDDHSYQTISAYDNRYLKTPNLDRIANEGVRFDNAYVGNSISGPSRAIMLTGKFSHKNGFKGNSDVFDGSQQTYPKLLQQAGYETAVVGKWHLVSEPTGFDYWNILPGQGIYYNPYFNEMGDKKRINGYATTVTTDIALDWLENKRTKEKPFCLLLHHKAPHRTWMPDTTELNATSWEEEVEFPLPETFYDNYEGRMAAQKQKMSIEKDMHEVYDLKMVDDEIVTAQKWMDAGGKSNYEHMDSAQAAAWDKYYNPIIADYKEKKRSGKELTEWKFQRYMNDYVKCIRSLDNNIGRVLDYLEKEGMLDNTLIVYTSDQGFYMGEHGWFDKRFMYEESFRTPLMMRLPGGKSGVATKDLVQNIDFAPTFLSLAGVEVPNDMQGESLIPILTDKTPDDWRNSLYYHYYEYPDEHTVMKHYGVRDQRYKLIRFYGDGDSYEFYDLQEDPREMNNLYGKAEYKDKIEEMKKELVRLQQKYDDQNALSLN
ncbi:MAG: sulfatase family protein [Bacteroidales bacterium]